MAAWMNLLRKEWRLAQKFTVGGLLIMTVALLIGIGCSVYYPYGISSLLFFIGCITFLLLHVFIYLIVSFASERNSQTLWMQTPLPGWSLIAAKVAAAILSMVILTVYDWIFQSRMIQWFEWGSVRVSDTALELNGTSFQIYLETMSLGQLLFNFILVGLVVFICGWILDRKVEV